MRTGMNRKCLMVAFLALVKGGACVVHADGTYYDLLTSSRQQTCSVIVNGYPISLFSGTNTVSTTTVADPFLLQGTNVIRLLSVDSTNEAICSSVVTLSYGLYGRTNRTAVLELVREALKTEGGGLTREKMQVTAGSNFQYEVSAWLNNIRTCHTLELSTQHADYQQADGLGTNEVAITLVLDAARLTTLPWLDSIGPLSDADRAAIRALVSSQQQALATGNVDQLIANKAARHARYAAARGIPLADEEAQMRSIYEAFLADPSFTVLPLDTGLLSFQTFGNANLVRVLLNGDAPIRATGGTSEGSYTYKMLMFASKVSGVWVLVE